MGPSFLPDSAGWPTSEPADRASHRHCAEEPCERAPRRRQMSRQGRCSLMAGQVVVLAMALLSGADATGSKTSVSSIGILSVRPSPEDLRLPASRQKSDGSIEDIEANLELARRGSFRARKLMMVSTPMLVGGLGEGIVVLLTGYILLFLTCFVGCNVQGGWKCYCPVFIVVLIATLILILAPKWPMEQLEEKYKLDELKNYDTLYIPQVLVMTAIWVGAAAGIIIVLCCHWAHPVYARALDD